MELNIKGSPKEIAALVVALQERHGHREDIYIHSGSDGKILATEIDPARRVGYKGE